jgi:hypothetical protein
LAVRLIEAIEGQRSRQKAFAATRADAAVGSVENVARTYPEAGLGRSN